MVDRSSVIQAVLDLFPEPRYLEIGVDSGDTFQFVSAKTKVAVDPHFKFSLPPNSDDTSYFSKTSDDYFSDCPVGNRFDVVYIDGLHTFEQSLRDLTNSLSRLDPKGVLIVDDVLPASYHSSLPSIEQAFQVRDHLAGANQALKSDHTWMGSVYKLMFFVQTFLQQLSYATVRENHGQLIAWFQPRSRGSFPERTVLSIGLLEFSDTVTSRNSFNLQPLEDILSAIKRAHSDQ